MKSMQSYLSMVILLSAICISFAQPQAPELLWHAIYPGIWTEAQFGGTAFDLKPLPDNSFVMTAKVIGRRPSESGLWLCRVDSAGDVIWADTIRFQDRNGEGNEGRRICITNDENLAVVGTTNLNGNPDVMFVLADTTGEVLLKRNYGSNDRREEGIDICQTKDGYAIFGLDVNLGMGSGGNYLLIRIDVKGDSLWSQTYGQEGKGYNPMRVLPLSDDGFLLFGYRVEDIYNIGTDIPIYLIRTDYDGEVVWEQAYMFQDEHGPNPWGILPNGDDEFMILTSTGSYPYLCGIDGEGEVVYEGDLMIEALGNPWDFTRTANGGFAIAGDKLQMIRTDSDGNELYCSTYSDSLDRVAAFTISITSDSGYCLGGRNWEEGGAALWRLGPENWPDAVREPDTAPQVFMLYPAFPNPFNALVRIPFAVPYTSDVKVSLFDPTGREVSVLVNGSQTAGRHEVLWMAKNAPTGLYFIQMSTPNITQTQKVVLIK